MADKDPLAVLRAQLKDAQAAGLTDAAQILEKQIAAATRGSAEQTREAPDQATSKRQTTR